MVNGPEELYIWGLFRKLGKPYILIPATWHSLIDGESSINLKQWRSGDFYNPLIFLYRKFTSGSSIIAKSVVDTLSVAPKHNVVNMTERLSIVKTARNSRIDLRHNLMSI